MASDRIDIVGLACRLPGARGAAALWHSGSNGGPFVPLDATRFDRRVYETELPVGLPEPLLGALLDDFTIDWRALNMPPMQVERLHRMEKVALATMIEALGDAGITTANALGSRARVFVAASTLGPDPLIDHGPRIRRHEVATPLGAALRRHLPAEAPEIERVLETMFDRVAPRIEPDSMRVTASMIAGRLASIFDFRGGHLAIDASASSSLVAVEEAVAALEAGECDVACVAAVSPLLTPFSIVAFARSHAFAATTPVPFSANGDGDGTLLGEGCAAIVLARHGALGGPRVHACIAGIASAVAADRADSEAVSAAVERATGLALDAAAANAPAPTAIETRACGIRWSDRAESEGLRRAYARASASSGDTRLTSAVARVGFLQAASGMVALVRAAYGLSREPRSADAVGVSDAGLAPVAGHAVLVAAAAPRGPGAGRARGAPMLAADAMSDDDIAIVGMGISVPQATDLETYWHNIVERVESTGDFPPARWDVDRFIGTSGDVGSLLTTRLAGVVADAELAMAVLPRPACDPAEALAFRSAARALGDVLSARDAVDADRVRVIFGQIPLRAGETDLERGILLAGHLDLAATAMREVGVEEQDVQAVIDEARRELARAAGAPIPDAMRACSSLSAATHVAAARGFHGGALAVDGACASSLAAIELGSRSLRDRSSDMVVAGAVAFNLLPEYYIALSMLGALSPRAVPAFHVGTKGFVPAEGAGAVVLKRFSDARRDGDRVYAIIRGIGLSSDGRGTSIFAPSTLGQQLAMRRALDAAGAEASSIDLIEAHGAGTVLGDRAEMEGYAAIYAARERSAPLSVGSIKSQIGHLSSAAGVAGLIKAALALRQRTLPPSVGSGVINPELSMGGLPIELATRARPWVVPPGRPRRAAVSAFGIGGVNYHVVLEEPDHVAARLRRTLPVTLKHPAPLPAHGTLADRFTVELTPLAIPDRPPRFPLTGKRIAVIADPGARWKAIVHALEARGATAVQLPADAPIDEAMLAELDGVVDVSTFRNESDASLSTSNALADAARAVGDRTFDVLRRLEARLADEARPCCIIAATSLGGDLGLAGSAPASVPGAFLLGLLKALKQELPHLLVRTVDFAPGVDDQSLGQAVAREIEDGGDRMEVGYAPDRRVTRLRRESFAEDDPLLWPIMASDVALVSGGGRGVLFECACALARLGVDVVVTGRTPLPEGDAPWLEMDDEAFEAFRRAELARRFAVDRTLSPVRFAREFEQTVRQRELHRNLRHVRETRLPLRYERCDVTSADDVRDLMRRVRSTYGSVNVLIHGAMVEHSTSFVRKDAKAIERSTATKVTGLLHLLDAVADDPPRTVLAFSSGAARFGNRGQTDYAAANAMMTAVLAARARELPGTRCVTMDWTAWSGVGAAVADPTVKAAIRTLGITSIRPEEGTYWFLSELALGVAGEVVIMEERMLHDWPFLGATADGRGRDAVELDDGGLPLVPGRWPMIDRVVARSSTSLTLERRLQPQRDPLLGQHRLNGVPILPFTFGCELMAEAAALFAPGYVVERLENARVDIPVKFFRDAAVTLRVQVELVEDSSGIRVVEIETRSDFVRNGVVLQRDRLHHSARVVLREVRRRGGLTIDIPERAGLVKSHSLFQGLRDPVELGPIYHNAAWIQTFEREVIGSVRVPRHRELFSDTSYPVFQVDPLVLDTAFQIAANWDGHHHGLVSIPISVDRLTVNETRPAGQGARVRAAVVRVEDPDVIYDLVIASEEGTALIKVNGLRLRRVGPVERGVGA